MRTSHSKEVRVFCDKETQTALVRVFKFRNYIWAGGETMELKKDSPQLQRIFDNILKFSVEPIDKSAVLWKEDNETAITYVLNMEKKHES